MTITQLDAAITGLTRIREAMYLADLHGRRRATRGRIAEVELQTFDLMRWATPNLDAARAVGVDLARLASEALDQIDAILDEMHTALSARA